MPDETSEAQEAVSVWEDAVGEIAFILERLSGDRAAVNRRIGRLKGGAREAARKVIDLFDVMISAMELANDVAKCRLAEADAQRKVQDDD